jgi:hypothetical protein
MVNQHGSLAVNLSPILIQSKRTCKEE